MSSLMMRSVMDVNANPHGDELILHQPHYRRDHEPYVCTSAVYCNYLDSIETQDFKRTAKRLGP